VRYPRGLDRAVLYGRPFWGALFSGLLLPTRSTGPGSAGRPTNNRYRCDLWVRADYLGSGLEFLRATVGLRVSEEEEYRDVEVSECGLEAYSEFTSNR